MLKWIKKRTRRTSTPSSAEPSCISGEKQSQPTVESEPLNNQVCPLCRRITTEKTENNYCPCGHVNLDSSDIIDYDTIKRQAKKMHSIQIKNNLKEPVTPTSYFIPKSSPLGRSRSDVTDLKHTRKREPRTRLSPRSRHPIINPADFAELSSDEETSGYGDSCTSQSGYSSDDSFRNLFQNTLIQPKVVQSTPSPSPCASPVPKMGCRAMIQRSASVNGRKDMTHVSRTVTLRSQSLNRTVRPACGVKRSKSRATSFRQERPSINTQIQSADDDNHLGSSFNALDSHISQLAEIRTELQNLYSLDKTY